MACSIKTEILQMVDGQIDFDEFSKLILDNLSIVNFSQEDKEFLEKFEKLEILKAANTKL